MSKTNETSKLLTDSELDVVSGGFFADYVKQLLANSEPGRGSSFLNSFAKAMGDAGK